MNWALSPYYKILFSLAKRDETKTTSLLLIFTFLTLSYFLVSYPQAKELPFENVPIEEGIPTIVQSINQDKVGYLWFATWSGLYKYDGYNFISYQNDIEDTSSIIDNTLNVVYEDKTGIFWIGSQLGLERFDPQNETFLHFTPNPNDTGDNLSNQIKAIHEDKNGILWIGSGNGLYNFDRKSKKFSKLTLIKPNEKADVARISVQSFYEKSNGNLWIGTDRGLYKFDLNTSNLDTNAAFTSDKFSQFSVENRKLLRYWSLPSVAYKPGNINATQQINSIFGEDTCIIWLGTNGGLVELS